MRDIMDFVIAAPLALVLCSVILGLAGAFDYAEAGEAVQGVEIQEVLRDTRDRLQEAERQRDLYRDRMDHCERTLKCVVMRLGKDGAAPVVKYLDVPVCVESLTPGCGCAVSGLGMDFAVWPDSKTLRVRVTK